MGGTPAVSTGPPRAPSPFLQAQGTGSPSTHTRQARQLVVHHGGHVKLEELHVLSDDMRGCAVLLVAPKLIVDLHDVGQLVCQVILRQDVRTITIQPTLSAWPACASTRCLSPSLHTTLGGSSGPSVHRSRSTFVSSNLLKGLTKAHTASKWQGIFRPR